MILTASTIGYLSANTALFVLSSAVMFKALALASSWDFTKSTKTQYENEKVLHLLSTVIHFILYFKIILTLYLFYMIDSLTPFIKAAMCGVGVLNATNAGWELIGLKIAMLFAFLLWIATDKTDKRMLNYPFTKLKIWFFIFIYLLLLLEIALDFSVIFSLDTQKVVSCCSVTFSNTNVVGSFVLPSWRVIAAVLGASFLVHILFVNLSFMRYKIFTWLSLLFSAVFIVVGLFSIIYFVSPYIYENPSHTCPFCILQKEYYYVGYGLYITLFLGSYYGVEGAFKTVLLNQNATTQRIQSLAFSLLFALLCLWFIFSYIFTNGVNLYG
jgi:hypothetical protein